MKTGGTLDDSAVSRCFSGYDLGGEVIGRPPGNCGVVCSERDGMNSTSRGTAEDAGDGGSSDVSTK